MANDPAMAAATHRWMEMSIASGYSYNFNWLGVPIIQYPQDVVAVQELLWRVRPQLVVETGIAHGGSLLLSASILELIGGSGHVLGIDIDIRPGARRAIAEHPLAHRITTIEGSSTAPDIAARVHAHASGLKPILVMLDSMHTGDHVRQELDLYSPLVTAGSYLIVFDTIIEDLSTNASAGRPWGPGDNPRTAVADFLSDNRRFVADDGIQDRLLISVAPGGYLKCVRDL